MAEKRRVFPWGRTGVIEFATGGVHEFQTHRLIDESDIPGGLTITGGAYYLELPAAVGEVTDCRLQVVGEDAIKSWDDFTRQQSMVRIPEEVIVWWWHNEVFPAPDDVSLHPAGTAGPLTVSPGMRLETRIRVLSPAGNRVRLHWSFTGELEIAEG